MIIIFSNLNYTMSFVFLLFDSEFVLKEAIGRG